MTIDLTWNMMPVARTAAAPLQPMVAAIEPVAPDQARPQTQGEFAEMPTAAWSRTIADNAALGTVLETLVSAFAQEFPAVQKPYEETLPAPSAPRPTPYEPQITNHEPRITNDEPRITNDEPRITSVMVQTVRVEKEETAAIPAEQVIAENLLPGRQTTEKREVERLVVETSVAADAVMRVPRDVGKAVVMPTAAHPLEKEVAIVSPRIDAVETTASTRTDLPESRVLDKVVEVEKHVAKPVAVVLEKPVAEVIVAKKSVVEAVVIEKPVAEAVVVAKPVAEAVVTEKPVTKPVSEAVVTEKPVTKPVSEVVVIEKPVTKPVSEAVVIEKPVTKPVAEAVVVEKPVAKPVVEAVVVEKPVAKPVAEEVVTEKPVAKPVAEEVVTEKPVAKPVAEAVVIEKPVAKPVAEAVVVEKPVAKPVAEAVVVEKPAAKPVVEAVVLEKPVAEAVVIERPVVRTESVAIKTDVDGVVLQALPTGVPEVAVTPVASDKVDAVSAVGAKPVVEVTSASEMILEVANDVADTLLVSPGLMRGEGELRVLLKPTVLDGSAVSISVTGRTLNVSFTPATPEAEQLLTKHIADLQTRLASSTAFYEVAVTVAAQLHAGATTASAAGMEHVRLDKRTEKRV